MLMKTKQELTIYFNEEGFSFSYETVNGKEPSENDSYIIEKWYDSFKEDKLKALFYIGFGEKSDAFSASVNYLYFFSSFFIHKLTQQSDIELTREDAEINLLDEDMEKLLGAIPFAIGMEYITSAWIKKIWTNFTKIFAKEISNYQGTVESFLTEHNTNIHVAGRVFFHLVEAKLEDYPFAFLATYSTEIEAKEEGLAKNVKRVQHVPLKNALLEYRNDEKMLLKLLSTVSIVADRSTFISGLMESGELFSPIKLSQEEAYIFLKESPIYEEAGILCRMPNWWKKKTNRLGMSVSVGEKQPSKVGMDAILSFRPELVLGEDKITPEEVRQLLNQTEGLALIKGKWIEINHERLRKVLEAFERADNLTKDGGLTLAEAMRLELNVKEKLGLEEADIEIQVKNGEWLNQIREKLSNLEAVQHQELSDSFYATLRPYQQKGFDWLSYMCDMGFGACLADDMGLGKTVQILALLESMRVNRGGKVLLIIPASLIGNWQKEIEKFSPKMPIRILHGNAQDIVLEQLEGAFLYITTYGMAVRLEQLRNQRWNLIILDEAQAIKNPGTKQTKAIKQLKADSRIAMTGTPIENRLSDLWSLFDFLDAGLLGTQKEFTNFTKKLKDNNQDYARLRRIVNPFILRRLKTDKTVISDLPEKIEIKEYVTLSKKQVMLYNNLLKEIESKLKDAEGIGRKGLVLASIIKIKQICNHPDQFLGQSQYKCDYSGKFERLKEICETIYEKRERVLVFTQFKEITEPISDFLETVFHRKGLVLHGGTAINKRSELVEQFNGEEYVPYMVLSIKAGGVGLNLTAANHVIHFDRWWNPAVENQATDRAFRIGQTKNVMVYKFVTTETIEEKIDAMIEEKQKMAGDIMSTTGENWITELDNNEIMELFSLGGGK